jgi:hypothetical protein
MDIPGRSKTEITERLWHLVAAEHEGLLCTLSAKEPGFPFGSLVNYSITADRRFVFSMSPLAEHFKNLEQHAKASLFVIEKGTTPSGDRSRATILLDLTIAPPSEAGQFNSLMAHLHRGVPSEVIATFRVVVGTVHAVRWIGGFGEARWIRQL